MDEREFGKEIGSFKSYGKNLPAWKEIGKNTRRLKSFGKNEQIVDSMESISRWRKNLGSIQNTFDSWKEIEFTSKAEPVAGGDATR